MKILALDMGKSKSVACTYDKESATHSFQTLSTRPQAFHDLMVQTTPDLVVIETGPLAGWVSELCQRLGMKLLVANTSAEPWLWKKVKRKTDRDDALKLAKLAALNQIQAVHVPSSAVRQHRELIGQREDLLVSVNGCKCRIRAILDRRAIAMASGDKAWRQEGRRELLELCVELAETGLEELWRGMLKLELNLLEQLEEHMKSVEKKLDAIGAQNQGVQVLLSASGVGMRLAEVVVSTLDEPRRFTRGKQVGCYAGLTPRQFQSGQMDLQGHISHAGNGLLRKRLIQVAWLGVWRGGWMKQVYEQVRRGSDSRKKLAIVAVARRLLVRLWAMLRDGRRWVERPSSASVAVKA